MSLYITIDGDRVRVPDHIRAKGNKAVADWAADKTSQGEKLFGSKSKGKGKSKSAKAKEAEADAEEPEENPEPEPADAEEE